MRDIKGDNNGIIIDKSTTIVVENERKCKYTEIQKEETSLMDIVKEKMIEAIIGAVLTGIATVIKNCQSSGIIDSWENGIVLFLLGLMIVFFIFGVGMLVIAIFDVIKILTLSHTGSYIEMESKFEWLRKFMEIFQRPENIIQKEERDTGKFYKNIDGKIYRIISKKCPICETEPIGKMYLIYSNSLNKYFWKCTQNHSHKVEFDYKKKI